MSPDILILHDGDGYRILHGHLHLASMLELSGEVLVDVSGEGKVKVLKTLDGLRVAQFDGSVHPLSS